MGLRLFNTLTREKQEFTPLVKGQVGLYTCGPTVYAAPHLGNLRTYLFEDILRRTLQMNGLHVNHVMNITDVGHLTSDADNGEDKMEKGAQREGKSVWEVAEFYTDMFKSNLKKLNMLEPKVWCKATDHIAEQITLIKKLEERGYTYQIADGVYFNTAKLADYGKLSHSNISGIKEGARVEANPEKLNPTDFALWKFSPVGTKRQMEWSSPWGTGFPGWHIECSAMAMKYLGETFDIHCGGIDHIAVHHNNEIAQSEAASGQPFVKYWMHGEFLVTDDKRMGKSEGNSMTLDWLEGQGMPPLAYRYFCLGTHYRKPLNFSLDAIKAAASALQTIHDAVATMGEPSVGDHDFEKRFLDVMNDDLNSPKALAIVWELLKSGVPDHAKKQSLLRFDEILGLGLKDILPLTIPQDVINLAAERETARNSKDWAKSDLLRDELTKLGFTVDDTDLGPIIKPLRS